MNTRTFEDFADEPASRPYVWFTEGTSSGGTSMHTTFEYITNSNPQLAIEVMWTEDHGNDLSAYTNTVVVPPENWVFAGQLESASNDQWSRRIVKSRFHHEREHDSGGR